EQDLGELVPRVLLAVDGLEALAGDLVARVATTHALEDLRRLRLVVDLLLPDRAGLEQRLLLLHRIVEHRGALLEHVDALLPAGFAGEERLERGEGAEV